VGIVLPGIGKKCTNFLKRESLAKTFIRAKVAWENNLKFSGPNACKMSSVLRPLLVVLVPLVGLAALHLFLPVVASLLMESAELDPAAFGWIAGAAGLGSVWLYMANHGVTPALGPLGSLRAGVLIAVAGGLLIMTASLPAMIVGAILLGFGYATSTPASSQILVDHTPKQNWSTLFSVRQAGVPLGGIIAGGLGGWSITHLGWRPAFSVMCVLCLCLAAPLVLAPRHYNTARPLQPFRMGAIFALSNFLRPFRAISLAPGLTQLALACTGFAMVQSACFSFFVIYLHAGLGYGLALAGTLFAVLQAASVVGRIVFGYLADRIGSPRPVLMVLAGCSAGSALLLAALGSDHCPLLLFTVAGLAGASVATWNGLYLAEVANLAPAHSVGEATAGTTFFVFLTYTVTPPVFSALINAFSYECAFITTAVGAATSGLVLLSSRTKR
jgi:MFS family permease